MQLRRDFLRSLEAALVGLFFVQALRYLYAALYAHVSSANLLSRLPDPSSFASFAGYTEPAKVQNEIMAVIAVFFAPLLALLVYRIRWSLPLAVAATVIARYLALQVPDSSVLISAVVVAGGLLYLTLLIIRRPSFLPAFVALGVGGDQIIRAFHSTADPSFSPDFQVFGQIPISSFLFGVAIFTLVLTILTTLVEREEQRMPRYEKQAQGILNLWSALALGGILFLELSLLGLPNAVARWANLDYSWAFPLILLATLLPLVPEVRNQASNFISIFDGIYRGWLWALMLTLFLVVGRRFEGLPALLLLSGAQFLTILTLSWLVKQPAEKRRLNPTPFFILLSSGVLALLSLGDNFTYDYAFVRPTAFTLISDLLTGMRGMGLPLAITAALLACLPMILERQIIPWRGGKLLETFFSLTGIIFITLYASGAAASSPIRRPLNPDCLRIATFNIHGGYNLLFANNLEWVAETIERSGADIALLQEVEAGLLRSGGIDQARWLADRLNMRATFYPQNESLQGLAILSRLDVRAATGAALTSVGAQAGVQYVTYVLDQAGDLHVYNVWLGYSVRERDGQPLPDALQDQNIQVEEVYRLIAANHFGSDKSGLERVILGGTFNYDESSPLYARWEETIFTDPFTSLFAESRATLFTIDGKSARWDYLWLLNLIPSGINIDQRNLASDHRPSVVAVGREAGRACPS